MTPARILTLYRWTFVSLIVAASVQTLLTEASHHGAALALVEIAGALLLLWPRSQIAGSAVLLLVFALAQILTAWMGQWPTHFLQYAASAILIVSLDGAISPNRVQSRSR